MLIKMYLQMEATKCRVENKAHFPHRHGAVFVRQLQDPFPPTIYDIYNIKRALRFFSKRIYYPKGCVWEKANSSLRERKRIPFV